MNTATLKALWRLLSAPHLTLEEKFGEAANMLNPIDEQAVGAFHVLLAQAREEAMTIESLRRTLQEMIDRLHAEALVENWRREEGRRLRRLLEEAEREGRVFIAADVRRQMWGQMWTA